MKKIAILQSNYIPWKGVFDMMNKVDIFVFFEDVDFTKRDWRTRNKIKTPEGEVWLSIPVKKSSRGTKIYEIEISQETNWQEKHYQTIFYLLFRLMGQYVDTEVKSAIGRADVVVKMQDAIYVFEFKVDGTPEEALEQINSKGYIIPYQPDHRKVVKVGVNFDSATRSIGDWKIVEEV